jgi:hypothetical protein
MTSNLRRPFPTDEFCRASKRQRRSRSADIAHLYHYEIIMVAGAHNGKRKFELCSALVYYIWRSLGHRNTIPELRYLNQRLQTIAAFVAGARALDLSDTDAFAALGRDTGDVYLNDTAYWSNIPVKAWDYPIGGYQVIKKWLSYRELDLLGRGLTPDEIRYVTEMARRIATILLLQTKLDANYRAVIADSYGWPPS